MSNKKDKQRWLNIQRNKEKCCANCSQLHKSTSGDYRCGFLKSPNDHAGAYVIIRANEINRQGKKCFDEYNGKNVKPNGDIVYY